MKLFLLLNFLLMSFVFVLHADVTPVGGTHLDELCRQAGGTPPTASVAKAIPMDTNHHDGVLRRGPVSCLCGKKVFTPRPGDTCSNETIHTAYENFCSQVQGTFVAPKKADSSGKITLAPRCLCGSTSLVGGECCKEGAVNPCKITLNPTTWPTKK